MEKLHPNTAYIDYFNIESNRYSEKISFYEEHKASFDLLLDEVKVEVELDYLLAVFEVGRYDRFLSKVDAFIEWTIIENVETFQEKDIFSLLLFKKAASLYNTSRISEATYVLKELIKIDPKQELYRKLFRRCHRIQFNSRFTMIKGLIVFLLISFIIISVVQLLIVDHFFAASVPIFQYFKIATVGSALALWIGFEGYQWYSYQKEVQENTKTKKAV